LRSSCRRVAVSSRGQDTWFSATGPGFESPYRYHKRCNVGHSSEHRTERNLSFEAVRSSFWRESERPRKHFSYQSASVLDLLHREQRPPCVEMRAHPMLHRRSIETAHITSFKCRDRRPQFLAPHSGRAQALEQGLKVASVRDRIRQIG